MYMGLAAPLMVQALQAAFSSETPEDIPYWDGLLLVYAGLFLTFLFACLFGINMYVWAKARINYKFIFEVCPFYCLTLPGANFLFVSHLLTSNLNLIV